MLRVLVNAEEARKFSRGGLAGYDFDVEVVAFPVAPCSHLEKVGVGIVVMLALLVRRREVPRPALTVGGSPSLLVRLSGERGPWQPRQLQAQDVQLAPRRSQYSGRQDLQK